ncbi:MAG: HPP family protein [Alphaproteobacteria bacterium]|nr:HPP family protein [Alphaproteobacteria bacterium]MBF0251191.1 HPP family protein [Alphaproteobacteria bacterium]
MDLDKLPPFPHQRPDRPAPLVMVRAFVGAALGIGLLGAIAQFVLNDTDLLLLIGAFGASAVLVYGVPTSPLAQPSSVLGGHLVSATVGVSALHVVGEPNWLAAALAVSAAIVAMQFLRCVHAPGGASALIAVVGSPAIHDLGFWYVAFPVGAGALILLAVALVTNNVGAKRRWPLFW